jgi:spore coat protein U-like protein
MKARICFIAAGAMLWLTAGSAEAQDTLTGTLDVSLELTSSCTIAGDDATTGADFGVIDFGEHAATFVGEISQAATGGASGSGDVMIVCSPDVESITVQVGTGNNPGAGDDVGEGSRALAGPNGGFVPYEVYQDSGHTVAYEATALPYTIPVAGDPFQLPIYGLINKTSPSALPVGSYADELTVTITF